MKLPPFHNEPVLELRRASVRGGLGPALAELDAKLPLCVPGTAGEQRLTGDRLVSTDPGAPDRIVAEASSASASDVSAAVEEAAAAAPAWRQLGAPGRAEKLVAAATWMRERRLTLAALEVRECAKPWPEADADVCEAIDFLEYYARAAVELEQGRELLQAPGERNTLRYVARGLTAVIAPWNFPIAIACGMSAAALATGNPVLLKPAEQSPGCAGALLEALRAGGVPDGVITLLPGEGDVGARLVSDAEVATIAFTGSLPVGLEIIAAAAKLASGQRHLKRVVAELGGKNCVIVDADADLDEAVPAIVASAFVYAGQKCSAAARVLVNEAIGEALVERVAGAVEVLAVGQAAELSTDVPPLIDAEAQQRVQRYASLAGERGEIVAQVEPVPAPGWFCAPTVVRGLAPESPVLREEVFGPLLTIETVSGLEQACARIDELPYALTGGLFTRSPQAVGYVSARLSVGNLYVNRGITGAMVGRQPFGGNRLSGTGTKAGGPDYLLSFVEPRTVTENTMRHGLVV